MNHHQSQTDRLVPNDSGVSPILKREENVAEEHQWWARAGFAALSGALVVLSFRTAQQFIETPDVQGALLLGIWLMLAAGCAIFAAPVRFHKRYFRSLLIATLLLELVTNVLIILK